MSIFTAEQWIDAMAQVNRFFEHVVNVFHHPEVIIVGIPTLIVLMIVAVLLWLIHKDLSMLVEVLV